MNPQLRRSALAVVILGISAPVWSAAKENPIQPTSYYDDPFTNSAHFDMEDTKLQFKQNTYTFTAESDEISLFDSQYEEVELDDGSFSLMATTDQTGKSASGYFSFVSAGTEKHADEHDGGGYQFDPGLLFSGNITDIGWSESDGFLEFAANNLKGQVCDLGWCPEGEERLWFHTGDDKRNGLNLGLVDENGEFKSFRQDAEGVAIVPAPAAVPVPAAVWLLGSGLLGMAGVARRKSLPV